MPAFFVSAFFVSAFFVFLDGVVDVFAGVVDVHPTPPGVFASPAAALMSSVSPCIVLAPLLVGALAPLLLDWVLGAVGSAPLCCEEGGSAGVGAVPLVVPAAAAAAARACVRVGAEVCVCGWYSWCVCECVCDSV